MRVFFIPQFYYMQYPPFRLVINDLLGRGIDASLVYIPGISEHDETGTFNPQRFRQDDIPFYAFKLIRIATAELGPFHQVAQFIQFVFNRAKLRKFLETKRPDAVVIGSHLGQMYIRQLQVFCYKMRIPVIGMWIIPASLAEKKSIPPFICKILGISDVMQWKFYNQYMAHHVFVTTGDALRREMIASGVKDHQVVVTGNPLHDDIFMFLKDFKAEDRIRLLNENNLDKNQSYIIFLTEVIQDVLGIDYLKDLLTNLHDIFDKLPCDIKVLIKYHPREPRWIKDLHSLFFSGPRYRFSESPNLIPLLKCAELSLGHYTSALETSAVVGTPCLSIKMSQKDANSLFKEKEFKILECNSFSDLEEKITMFFNDKEFSGIVNKKIRCWLKDNALIDGRSAERMAEVIIAATKSELQN